MCVMSLSLVLLFLVSYLSGSIISSSQLQLCVVDGNSSDLSIDCNKKILLAISIDGGQDQTETFEFSINNVTDADGEEYIIPSSLNVTCTKTVPYYSYQLTNDGKVCFVIHYPQFHFLYCRHIIMMLTKKLSILVQDYSQIALKSFQQVQHAAFREIYRPEVTYLQARDFAVVAASSHRQQQSMDHVWVFVFLSFTFLSCYICHRIHVQKDQPLLPLTV